MQVGCENITIFDQYLALSRKRCTIGPQLLWNANRNSYGIRRTVKFPITLNDHLSTFTLRRRVSQKRYNINSCNVILTLTPPCNIE